MKRVASLDGLRGIAVLLVVAQHYRGWQTGQIGVDIFFGLSGYLITTILLKEKTESNFWRIFYVRRLTRIAPVFVLLLLLCTFLADVQWRVLWPYVLFTGSNIALFTRAHEMTAADLGILWSLCVEEHFYFLWPAQVRRFSTRTLVRILLFAIVLGAALRFASVLMHMDTPVRYFLTPFHLDGIVLGSLLAIALDHPSARAWIDRRITPVALLWVPLFIVLLPWLHRVPMVDVPGYIFFGFTSALMVGYLVLRPAGWVSRVLSLPPITFAGRISYGLYMFHLIVLHTFEKAAEQRHYGHPQRVVFASFVAAVTLSWLSFQFYETPFLKLGRRWSHAMKDETQLIAQSVHPSQPVQQS